MGKELGESIMEFHKKLQQLRKQQGLTQEQLAERLFVSRTAVSKWESGRGFPNLESLKGLSRLFSVSIDELLSNEELVELAQTENRSNLRRLSGLVFGILDLMTVALLLMPMFGQREGDHIRAVSLLESTGIREAWRAVYLAVLTVIPAFGLLELLVRQKGLRVCIVCSVAFHAAAILLFALSRQPYMTALLFLHFLVKLVLLMQSKRL